MIGMAIGALQICNAVETTTGDDPTGATRHVQGGAMVTGGGGKMQADNTSFAADQTFAVTAFTITEGNP